MTRGYDLTAADFVIREAGVRQEIAHFRAVAVDGTAPAPRTFFFVLGRGRLNHRRRRCRA